MVYKLRRAKGPRNFDGLRVTRQGYPLLSLTLQLPANANTWLGSTISAEPESQATHLWQV